MPATYYVTETRTGDRDLMAVQQELVLMGRDLSQEPLLGGVHLRGAQNAGVALSNGTTLVTHGLGRAPVGWFVTRQRGSARIYDTQDGNPNPTLSLRLVSDAAVLVDLYVF